MIEEIRELFVYNRWANDRMLDAVAPLSDEQRNRTIPSSFPSLHATLLHMLGAEWAWLERWKGTSPEGPPDFSALTSVDSIRKRWHEIDDERNRFLAALDDDSVRHVVAARTFAGAHFETPLWQMMRHVVNHASYHRGQITTMLRQLGMQPVASDLILFYRDGHAEAVT
jgi:uncharacterized damage-inducible protein DinB